MGRLTLNVLLSFAQFERAVIGERVRDKIASSKRKGVWVGGPVCTAKINESAECLAGAGGFEPPYGGIKIRCLTAWRRPKARGP